MSTVSSAQPAPLDHLAGVRRVAVFRALQLGDMLCAVPALRALRAALPEAHITLIGLPWAAEFAQRFRHYLDDFIAFPGAVGLPERMPDTSAHASYLQEVRARQFDLALQLHGDGRVTNRVLQDIGAQRVAGFYPRAGVCPDGEWFIAYPEEGSEVTRLLRLIRFLGIRAHGEQLEFPIRPTEWRALAELRLAYGLRPGEYACVHPGASLATRRWPARRFAAVADTLAARGLRIVVTGSANERELARDVTRAMHTGAINLAGQTDLGLLAALFTGARLLVCNDTGVSHVANALCVPSVVVYTASSPQRWASPDRLLHRAVFHEAACRPCLHARCPVGHPCANELLPDKVAQAAASLLNHGREA